MIKTKPMSMSLKIKLKIYKPKKFNSDKVEKVSKTIKINFKSQIAKKNY